MLAGFRTRLSPSDSDSLKSDLHIKQKEILREYSSADLPVDDVSGPRGPGQLQIIYVAKLKSRSNDVTRRSTSFLPELFHCTRTGSEKGKY